MGDLRDAWNGLKDALGMVRDLPKLLPAALETGASWSLGLSMVGIMVAGRRAVTWAVVSFIILLVLEVLF